MPYKKGSIPSAEKAALSMLARGQCYNPECHEPLITSRSGRLVINYEIAHIRDERPPENPSSDIGWRYYPDDDLTQEMRNRFENLILLCSPCHKLIDRLEPRRFSPLLLKEWKNRREGGNNLFAGINGKTEAPERELLVERKLLAAFQEASNLIVSTVSSEIDRVTSLITGCNSFPLCEFSGFDPKHHGDTSIYLTAVGESVLTNVGLDLCVRDLDGTGTVFASWSSGLTIPALHPGRRLPLWNDIQYRAKTIPVWPMKATSWLELDLWTNSGKFTQMTRFESLTLGENELVLPVLNEVSKVKNSGAREILYRHQYFALPDGRLAATSDPIIRKTLE